MSAFTSLRPRTVRSRIVAAVAALLVVGFAVVAVISTIVLHRVLLDRLDQQLRAAGDRFSVGLEHNDHDADNPNQYGSVEGQAAGTLGARVADGTVTSAAVVGRRSATDAVSPAADAVLARLHESASPRTVSLPGLGPYRLIVSAGRDGDLQITGLPTHPLDTTTDRFVLLEALVFAAAVLAIGVASALVVRRALRPLDEVAKIASSVAGLPLSSGAVRLPDRVSTGPSGSEIETVASAFNTMLAEVESALGDRHDVEERLRRFLADASHELRTPVAVVRGHAEYALRSGGQVPDEVTHALERIAAQSERMGHLVEDLLLLARLDSGRPLAAEDVDLTRIVLDETTDARAAGADHRWVLDLPDEAAVVTGDGRALHQVVANLLSNARVHTPAGTTVRAALRRAGSSTVLEVADDGPGIDPQQREHLFERFVRGDGIRSRTTGSSGLGLAIVEAIVAAHHGTVSLTSDAGGTRVTVTLPDAPTSAAGLAAAPATQGARTGR